jgi:hypothetical protein
MYFYTFEMLWLSYMWCYVDGLLRHEAIATMHAVRYNNTADNTVQVHDNVDNLSIRSRYVFPNYVNVQCPRRIEDP